MIVIRDSEKVAHPFFRKIVIINDAANIDLDAARGYRREATAGGMTFRRVSLRGFQPGVRLQHPQRVKPFRDDCGGYL